MPRSSLCRTLPFAVLRCLLLQVQIRDMHVIEVIARRGVAAAIGEPGLAQHRQVSEIGHAVVTCNTITRTQTHIGESNRESLHEVFLH